MRSLLFDFLAFIVVEFDVIKWLQISADVYLVSYMVNEFSVLDFPVDIGVHVPKNYKMKS